MKKLTFVLVLSALLNSAYSQMTPDWYDFYDGNQSYDLILSSGTDGAGNVFVTGNTAYWSQNSNWVTIKYDNNGNRQWVRTMDYAGKPDEAYKLVVDQNGDIYITGLTSSADGRIYMTTVKYYNSNGRIAWINRHSSDPYGNFLGLDLSVDQYGNAYAAGLINYGGVPIYVVVLKIDNTGQLQWERTFESFGEFQWRHLFIRNSASGNVYVAGHKVGETGYYLVKYDANGNLVWENLYNYYDSREDYCSVGGMAVDAQENIYLTGTSFAPSAMSSTYFTLKANSSGSLIWNTIYSGTDEMPFCFGEDLAYSSSGFVSVTGQQSDGNVSYCNFVTIKYDASNGSEQWVNSLEGSVWGNIFPSTCLSLDVFDNTWVAGTSSPLNGPLGYLTAGYTSGGNFIDAGIFYGDGNEGNHPFTISTSAILDPITDVFVGGMVSNADFDYGTVAYSVSGALLNNISEAPGYKIGDNYPNPFNPVTTITFEIPVSSNVKISVYDVTGKLVSNVLDNFIEAGVHKVNWDGSNVSSGIYFYRIEAGSFTKTKKMLLVK